MADEPKKRDEGEDAGPILFMAIALWLMLLATIWFIKEVLGGK